MDFMGRRFKGEQADGTNIEVVRKLHHHLCFQRVTRRVEAGKRPWIKKPRCYQTGRLCHKLFRTFGRWSSIWVTAKAFPWVMSVGLGPKGPVSG